MIYSNGYHHPSEDEQQKKDNLRIAIIGQSNFAGEVLELLLEKDYRIVGVFTPPDNGHREDILATLAQKYKIPVFKITTWRRKGVIIPDVWERYRSVTANLNVLAYCSQFIPMEVINYTCYGSICYHPSILPRHRGASAISWTLIDGDEMAGFSIFWVDENLDTGPILLQKQCTIEPTDTLDSLYKRFLYPEGIKSMVYAIDLISQNMAPKLKQIDYGATYDPPLFKEENQYIDLNQSAKRIWNFIRGLDSMPGALAIIIHKNNDSDDDGDDDGREEKIRLYGAHLYMDGYKPSGLPIQLKGLQKSAIIHEKGLLIQGIDGKYVNVRRLKKGNRMINACDWFKIQEKGKAENGEHIIHPKLNSDEYLKMEILRNIWFSILKCPIECKTDFFEMGGNSMDVIRLIEECKQAFDINLETEEIFMSTIFEDFSNVIIQRIRSNSSTNNNNNHDNNNYGNHHKNSSFNGFILYANKRKMCLPTQLFINGEFINAQDHRTFDVINPANEDLLCQVACASVEDVNNAILAAHRSFNGDSWRSISARKRGQLMFKLADLMEQYKEDLATIESVDSGALYTLALKTHIGMSIDVWRYFAGWCDKIQGHTIPTNPSQPNKILTYTRKEPLGVVGLIIPWNYPLMMLSWKMAACIAAGNTCVIKPAQTSPLTALKFAELTVKAGFPPGVINIVPGTGSEAGQAITDHPLVSKIGFTGSTSIGKVVMSSCARTNLKKCSLELGGKSPLVIFADCEFEKAVKYGISSVFFNKGENCIAAGRIFIEENIHDEFVRRVVREIRGMKIGNPLDCSTAQGPQNHRAHFEKLLEYCERGIRDGATLIYGGKAVPNMKGYYFMPTVFTDVEDHMYIAQEESFGPIMIISKFHGSDIESVIRRANNTKYGLASGVFTRDLSKALMFTEQIDAGTVFVNVYNKTDVAAPFGGFKQSGFGKDLGADALNEYLRTKCVTIEY